MIFFSPSLFYYCHYQCCHDYDFCDITLPFALHASFELHGVWCQQTFAAITEICCATSWNCICSGFTSGTFFLFHVCCFIVLDIPASAQPDLRKVENFLGNRTSCLGVIVSATVRCWHHHHLTSVVVIFMMITGSCAMMIGLCRCTHIAWWSIMLHSFKNKQMSYFSVFTQMTCVNMQKHLVWMCEFFFDEVNNFNHTAVIADLSLCLYTKRWITMWSLWCYMPCVGKLRLLMGVQPASKPNGQRSFVVSVLIRMGERWKKS